MMQQKTEEECQILDQYVIWEEQNSESESYDFFYSLNQEIIKFISDERKVNVGYWDVEHAFWNFNGNPSLRSKPQTIENTVKEDSDVVPTVQAMQPSLELNDYLIPKISHLYELGNNVTDSSAKKGSEFEKLSAEAFCQFDFELEMLGQGTGRNPDFLLRSKQTHTAFIVDAKAYSEGYSLGTNDRAIKEYIDNYCTVLKKEGFEKIGFIILSNSFKGEFDEFINQITWRTDIKRFILLETNALLYLIAYKNKEHLDFSDIIDCLTSIANPISAQDIISRFEDV